MFSLRNNNHGVGTILMVSAIMAGMLVTSAGVMRYLPLLTQQRTKTQASVDSQVALLSAVGYAKFAVQSHWCITDDWTRTTKNCDSLASTFSHPKSLPRILLRSSTIQQLKTYVPGLAAINPLLLDRVDGSVNPSIISPLHPLYPVLSKGGKAPNSPGVYIRVSRINNVALPTASEEIFLNFFACTITTPVASGEAKCGKGSERLTEVVALYGKEVGSYALLTNKDLRLDGASAAALGQIIFPTVSDTWVGKGISFLSPVFSNGSVYLNSENSTRRAPVTFAESITLGGGTVYQRDDKTSAFAPFVPRADSSLGLEPLLYTYPQKSFGGFLGGVILQKSGDLGLAKLFGNALSQSVADAQKRMNSCVLKNQLQGLLSMTENSRLVAQKLRFDATSSQKKFSFLIGLTAKNEFTGVVVSKDQPRLVPSAVPVLTGATVSTSNKKDPVRLKLMIEAGGRKAEMWLNQNSEVKGQLNPLSTQEELTLAGLPTDINKLTGEIQTIKTLVAKKDELQTELATEMRQDPINDGQVRKLESDIKDLERKIKAAGVLADKESELIKLQNQQKDLQDKKSDPTNLVISTSPPDSGSGMTTMNLSFMLEKSSAPPTLPYDLKATIYACDYGTKDSAAECPNLWIGGDQSKKGPNAGTSPGSILSKTGFFFQKTPPNSDEVKEMSGFDNTWRPFSTTVGQAAGATTTDPPDPSQDVYNTDCDSAQATGLAGNTFNEDFSDGTAAWWNFANPTSDDAPTDLCTTGQTSASGKCRDANGAWKVIFNDKTASLSKPSFEVGSIADECIIQATAELVMGFFTCRNLEIQRRTKPLQIIGTFIVDQLIIDPEALIAGITWQSIYHAQSTQILRQKKVLLPTDPKKNCNDVLVGTDPLWNPEVSLVSFANSYRCSPAVLREGADPFTWPEVNPLCGVASGASMTSCKLRGFPVYHKFVTLSSRMSL